MKTYTDAELDALDNANWDTVASHPASGLSYQETTTEHGAYTRVTLDGHEVVSPSSDAESIHKIYLARVARFIEEEETN